MIANNTSAGGSQAGEIRNVQIPPIGLAGSLHVPPAAFAVVAFAHGSGSSRLSPRNTAVARALNRHRFATLLFDLLTPAEEVDRANVFDIPLLSERLIDAVHWLSGQSSVAKLPVGLFGASTGAAAALVAATKEPGALEAVIGYAAGWFERHLAPDQWQSTRRGKRRVQGRRAR